MNNLLNFIWMYLNYKIKIILLIDQQLIINSSLTILICSITKWAIWVILTVHRLSKSFEVSFSFKHWLVVGLGPEIVNSVSPLVFHFSAVCELILHWSGILHYLIIVLCFVFQWIHVFKFLRVMPFFFAGESILILAAVIGFRLIMVSILIVIWSTSRSWWHHRRSWRRNAEFGSKSQNEMVLVWHIIIDYVRMGVFYYYSYYCQFISHTNRGNI